MSRGVNKVILVGYLGKNPEVRYSQSGKAVSNLSLATSESWKDKNTAEKVEKTEWHRVVAFDRLAEICGEYLKKGSQVYIEGKLQTRKWQDKDGHDRYTTEIVCFEMQMLGSRGDGQQGGAQPAGASADQYRAASAGAKPAKTVAGSDEDFNDEIQFGEN